MLSSSPPCRVHTRYDAFGNLQSIGGNSARNTPTAPSTNHLSAAVYDASGNLTSWNGSTYQYDPFHMLWNYKTASDEWLYLYTADDERAWTYKIGNTSLWTLRGPDNKVLREYANNGVWSVDSDYIYRGGQLLAAETPQGIRHFHLDHLGTPRLVSDTFGQQKAYHVYYPFGEEATAFNQDTLRAKFTGHERDLGNPGGAGDDLDYMHARFCSPLAGRFLSIDKADILSLQLGDDEDRKRFREFLAQPQSWSRYSYTKDNPLKYVDPDGKTPELAVSSLLAFGGGSGGATLSGLAAANPVGAVVLAGAGGVLVGTAINKIPGVSETITGAFEWAFDTIYQAQNIRQQVRVLNGLLATAVEHLGMVSSSPGPEKDPDFNHHKQEIKAALERALRVARRLPGKVKKAALAKILEIAEQSGVQP